MSKSISMLRGVSYLFSTVLILTFAGACHSVDSNAKAEKAQATAAVRVKLASVQAGKVRNTSEFIGRLESRRSIALHPQVDGRVAQIFVQPGIEVAVGTPLIQINPDRQQAEITSSRAAAASAQADVESAKASLIPLEADRRAKASDVALQQQQCDRYSTLYQEGAVSQEVLDGRRNNLDNAKAELDAAKARIEAQRSIIASKEKVFQQTAANVRGQQVELQYYQIIAPFAGTIGNIPTKVGDYVSPSTQLATITQNHPLEVNLSVPSERAADLRPGMTVQLINQQGKLIGNSQVFFISPNVNNQSESISIKALYTNPDGRLRADQQVLSRVIWDERPGVLVPTAAISRLGGKDFVFVAQKADTDLVARQRPVILGEVEDGNYQVIEGLKPGEQIVVSGLQQLSDGTAILSEAMKPIASSS
ncbi:efflux RND transporter periplasmic adaptor subunit [Nostoc sp. NMS1]|uniref:efflux RND transporter periplasmic adaptor subunit n=1 Tax=Nostoc sp. NMS1 TaxID=2815388 RepID=UPI0025D13679|nr:efflux RND transporter periplasmic adaptor subunit [Nostoc sp. NMS1]